MTNPDSLSTFSPLTALISHPHTLAQRSLSAGLSDPASSEEARLASLKTSFKVFARIILVSLVASAHPDDVCIFHRSLLREAIENFKLQATGCRLPTFNSNSSRKDKFM